VTKFQIAIRKFSVYFAKPIWSFIVNCVFWLFRLNKISGVRTSLNILKDKPIELVMSKYVWKEDTLGDWTPWVATIVYTGLEDDCDGAANLAKWWFKQHGIEAEILNLYSKTEGHTICVTRDRTKMVTNERVVELNPITWESDVMQYFGNKYEVIL
jgi:hypothetical protein